VAATEFVIGALFVNGGAKVFDIVVGLLLGNLAAVLSWALVCAPIAVQTRLTLYWYLRSIAGPYVMVVYNVLNAVLYCILAGAMITVSASAVRIPFRIPPQISWYPQDVRFVLVVVVVGAVVVTLAILGFKKLAQFAVICSPWLLVMFVAGALVLLPSLAAGSPQVTRICGLADFWTLARAKIWTGTAITCQSRLGFWHVAAFAWICNLAMHLGLSDMAIFRYARRASYGFYSAFGMFLGHYLAWICAGIMGAGTAELLSRPLAQLDAGEVAYQALGAAGVIAVVIAGWTTSNPTLYRAGLAFQSVTPNWARWKVTLAAGIVTTAVACLPFVFTKLLGFVGLYGLLLMPVGAIVTAEHWIFPHIGLVRFWATRKGAQLNVPALAAWAISTAVAMICWRWGIIHLFFLAAPVWLLALLLYAVFSALAGAARAPAPPSQGADCREASGYEYEPAAKLKEVPSASEAGPGWPGKQKIRFYQLSGLVALAALFVCLSTAAWVFTAPQESYWYRLVCFKQIVLWVSLIYFVGGVVWMNRPKKQETLE
jgi:NCS1 family nucleobase:cation symporter-1